MEHEENVQRRLNYRTSGKITYTADEIPTIAPEGAFKEFSKGDENPYFKLQRIDYPVMANGVNYTEKFFESFLRNLKDAPFPGAKDGHEMSWGKRGNTDFILVGGKIDSKGDGKGSVYLKNYIPPNGAVSSNETFIKECKAGMVHFSIVSYVKEERTETKDGIEINIIESMYGERNDAVDRGTGAMKQVTNANGESAAVGGKTIPKTEEPPMNREEFLKALANMKAAEITIEEMAKVLNATDKIVTKEQIEAVAVMNALKELKVTDPVKEIETLRATIEANAEAVKNAALDKEFGASTDENPNPLRQYAAERLANATYDDLMKGIKEVKDSPIAKAIAANMTDVVTNVGTKEPGSAAPEPKKSRVDKL